MPLSPALLRRMSIAFLFLVEFESDRPGNKRSAFFAGADPLGFEGFQLRPGLLSVADSVVCAKWYLLAARKQKFLAALHEVLLIESPGVHEILQHDHNHVSGDISDGQSLRQTARLARERQMVSGFR